MAPFIFKLITQLCHLKNIKLLSFRMNRQHENEMPLLLVRLSLDFLPVVEAISSNNPVEDSISIEEPRLECAMENAAIH